MGQLDAAAAAAASAANANQRTFIFQKFTARRFGFGAQQCDSALRFSSGSA